MSDPRTLKQMLAGYVVYTFRPVGQFGADVSELVEPPDEYSGVIELAEKIFAAFEPSLDTDNWQVATYSELSVIPEVDADVPERDLEVAMEMVDNRLPGDLYVDTVDEIVATRHLAQTLGSRHPNWLVLEISNNPA